MTRFLEKWNPTFHTSWFRSQPEYVRIIRTKHHFGDCLEFSHHRTLLFWGSCWKSSNSCKRWHFRKQLVEKSNKKATLETFISHQWPMIHNTEMKATSVSIPLRYPHQFYVNVVLMCMRRSVSWITSKLQYIYYMNSKTQGSSDASNTVSTESPTWRDTNAERTVWNGLSGEENVNGM